MPIPPEPPLPDGVPWHAPAPSGGVSGQPPLALREAREGQSCAHMVKHTRLVGWPDVVWTWRRSAREWAASRPMRGSRATTSAEVHGALRSRRRTTDDGTSMSAVLGPGHTEPRHGVCRNAASRGASPCDTASCSSRSSRSTCRISSCRGPACNGSSPLCTPSLCHERQQARPLSTLPV